MKKHPLERWMEVYGKSVNDLAAEVNVTPSHIRNLLAGRKTASLKLAKRLHDLSGGVVPLHSFLTEDAR